MNKYFGSVSSLVGLSSSLKFLHSLEAEYNSAPVTFRVGLDSSLLYNFGTLFDGRVSDFESFLEFCAFVSLWRFDHCRAVFSSGRALAPVFDDSLEYDEDWNSVGPEMFSPAFLSELVAVFHEVASLVREKMDSLELYAFYKYDGVNMLTLDLSADDDNEVKND